MFRIKPHIHQSLSEGSKKPLCAPGPRDSTETESDLPVTVCMSPAEARVSSGHRSAVGMGQQWAWVSSGHRSVVGTAGTGAVGAHNGFLTLGIQQRD